MDDETVDDLKSIGLDLDDSEFLDLVEDITPTDDLLEEILSYFNIEGELKQECFEYLKNLPRIPIVISQDDFRDYKHNIEFNDEWGLYLSVKERIQYSKQKHRRLKGKDLKESVKALISKCGGAEKVKNFIKREQERLKNSNTAGYTFVELGKVQVYKINIDTSISVIIHENLHSLFSFLHYKGLSAKKIDHISTLTSNVDEVLTEYFTKDIIKNLIKKRMHFKLNVSQKITSYDDGIEAMRPLLDKYKRKLKRLYAPVSQNPWGIKKFFEKLKFPLPELEHQLEKIFKSKTDSLDKLVHEIFQKPGSVLSPILLLSNSQIYEYLKSHEEEFYTKVASYDEATRKAYTETFKSLLSNLGTQHSLYTQCVSLANDKEDTSEQTI